MSQVYAKRAGMMRGYPVAAATVIAACSPVFLTAGIAVGYDDADETSQFAGIAVRPADNSDGAVGAAVVELDHQEIALMNAGDIGNDSVGSDAFFTDAVTVSIDSATDTLPKAGTITQLEGDLVWIKPAIV